MGSEKTRFLIYRFFPKTIEIKSPVKEERGHFEIVEELRDSDCLFRSIEKVVGKKRTENIRHKIVGFVVENWQFYQASIDDHFWQRFDRQTYKKFMSSEKQYGTLFELSAAAKLYGFVAHVIRKTPHGFSVYTFGGADTPNEDGEKQKLYWLLTGNKTEGHFRPLECIREPSVVRDGDYRRTKPGIDIVIQRAVAASKFYSDVVFLFRCTRYIFSYTHTHSGLHNNS